MKKLLIFLLVVCMLTCYSFAEEVPIHNLWDIDLNKMNVQQVHDYLEKEKGILSKIILNYDRENHNSLRTLDDQEITLLGYPFTLYYTEYRSLKTVNLAFRTVGTQQDAFSIIEALISKYGKPTLIYYDLYNRNESEWKHNIGEPMYHQRRILTTLDNFNIVDTLLNWEHYEESKYNRGRVTLYVYIDNIEIDVECGNNSDFHTVFVQFYSAIPSVEIEELDESKNISNYTDTGF